MKYTPLDLSFISKGSLGDDRLANVLAQINAGSAWNVPDKDIIAAYDAQQKEYEAATKPTFIKGFFDLLSSPLYGLAHGLDSAIESHQKDDTNGVLDDALGMLMAGAKGTAKGIGAGLRGSTAMLDVLPGVNFDDTWQSNPEDKTRFSDVNTRLATHMSTKEAMDPANWEEASKNIAKEKSELDAIPAVRDLLYPDLSKTDAREQFFKKMGILGIAEDIGGDPLNFVGLPFKGATGAKAITEGLEDARASTSLAERLAKSPEIPETFTGNQTSRALELPFSAEASKGMPLPGRVELPSTLKEELNLGAKPKEIVPPASEPTVPPALTDDMINEILGSTRSTGNPVTDAIIASTEAPKAYTRTQRAASAVGALDQKKMVQDIVTAAAKGDKGWVYKAAEVLQRHPHVDWETTSAFLDLMSKRAQMGKAFKPSTFAKGLKDRIAADALKAASPGEEIVRAVKNASLARVIKPGESGLKADHALIANKVIDKAREGILGKGTFSGMRSEANVTRAIARGDTAIFSGPKQVNIWNAITTRLGFKDPAKFDAAVRILRAVTNYFEANGAIAHSAASITGKGGKVPAIPLRLDQVAEAIGPRFMGMTNEYITKILEGDAATIARLTPEQQSALRALRESGAITSAPGIKAGIETGEAAANEIGESVASAGRKQQALEAVPKIAGQSAAASGAGDAGSVFARNYLKDRLAVVDPIDRLFKASRLERMSLMTPNAKRVVDAQYANRVGNTIYKAADLPSPKVLGKLTGPVAMVTEGLGARFNAAYAMKDMRKIFLREQGSALSTIARRTAYFNDLAKRFSPKDADLWHEAFRAAQTDTITAGRVSELQKEISASIESLIGGTGLRANALSDSTVIGRSAVTIKELNAALTRFGLSEYQFSNAKKVKDAFGNTIDLSKGIDWVTSWQYWDVKKPYEMLQRLQQAVEQTVRQKNMFDEIASRFASDKRFGNVKYGVNHPRLQGYYFTEEGARQAEQFIKVLNEVNTPNSKAMQQIDHVLSKLKASMTIYIPSHHWTNMIGDVMMNWFAGVNDVRRYGQAQKVIASQKGRYGDLATFQKEVVGPDALKQAVARSLVQQDAGLALNAAGNATVATMRNGTKVTADMIYTAMMKQGVLPSARVLEEVASDVTSILDKWRPFGGKVQQGVHQFSEWRDHVPRIAQFINEVSKSNKTFARAIEDAADSVRKWHPDGLDLTKFERGVMKRVFPFYSWTRKAIPLMIEASFLTPSKVMAYPRLMELMATANGVPQGDQGMGTFPNDQMFPDFIRERGIGPMFGGDEGYTVINPSTPAMDIMTMLGKPGGTALDMLNPMAKVPLELAQGATLGKQVPIDNQLDYLAKQVPGISQAGRVSGYYGTSKSVADSDRQKLYNLLNILTGAKATNTGIYQKSAQFDMRDYVTQKRKAARE